MALNLGSSGEFTPNIRWTSQTSSWQLSVEGGGAAPVQLSEFVIDMAGLKTGWCLFREKSAPQWVMDKSLSEQVPRPSEEKDAQGSYLWKRGFKVLMYSPSTFAGDGVREFATSATGACMGIDSLHDQYVAQAGANPGKVPVAKYSGPLPTKVGKGATNIPQFSIVKWVDRPVALSGSVAHVATGTGAAQPVAANASAAPVAKVAVSEF